MSKSLSKNSSEKATHPNEASPNAQAPKFQSKGYGLFFALVILVAFFWFVPKLAKTLWPFFLENLSQEAMVFILAMSCHTGVHMFVNSIMYLIYRMKHPFFERYKISDKPWPWESQPELWREILKKSLKTLAIAHFVIVPIILFVETRFETKMRMDLESFPGIDEIIQQIIFFALVEDFFFYWSHRILHHPKFYPYVHKVHHEYNIVISLAAEYAHPIELIFGNIIPYNVGPKLLGKRVHFATYLIWISIAQIETADQHSGYEFSWSPFRLIPFCGSATYHNFHHSHNVGNYTSLFTFWDSLCGTNIHYLRFMAKKKQKMIEDLIQGNDDKANTKKKD